MVYTPTEWKNGDIITAEKLNNIENGIANCEETSKEIMYVYLTTQDGSTWTSDTTYEEIKSAIADGFLPVAMANMPGRGIYYAPLAADFSDYVYFNKIFVNHNHSTSGNTGALVSINGGIYASGNVVFDMMTFALTAIETTPADDSNPTNPM